MKKKMISLLLSVSMLMSMSGMTVLAQSTGAVATEKTTEADGECKLRLWYNKPASQGTTILSGGSFGTTAEDNQWQQFTLPIGNSYMGANVYGEIQTERLTFNQKTLWNGGPSSSRPNYQGGNITTASNGKLMTEAYKDVVDAFMAGNSNASNLCNYLVGSSDGYGAYQSWGDIYLNFKGIEAAQAEDYERSLDLETGIAEVAFSAQGTSYHREYFVSHPDNVLVMKLTAEGNGTLDFNVSFPVDNAENVTSRKLGKDVTYDVDAADGTIVTAGSMQDNQMKMNSMLQVVPVGGTMTANADGSSLDIAGAKEAVIFVSADTDYKNEYPAYRTGETDAELAAAVASTVSAAKDKGYDQVKEDYLSDYCGLYDRLTLDLGQAVSDKPTDELLAAYKAGNASEAERRYLEVLLYQYGRYLTIASSRAGDLPSNLQGVWQNRVGDAGRVPWGSDYHMNVNLQMNYWPTYSANLAECAIPLIDYVDSLREPGRVTAATYYGIVSGEGEENGFTAHTQNTPFGWTCPGWDFSWGWSPAAVPWILQNCWEYYEYTKDEDFMRERIYPMLREEALLYDQILVDSGAEITLADGTKSTRLVSAPTYSPEHGPRTLGNAYEQELIWQLYEDTIIAAETLGVDAEKVAEWKETQSRLAPIEVGDSGQIKEWYTETTLGSLGERGHRHMSHLLGLFPGDLISVDNREYMDAVIVSLTDRGMKSTGWGMGQRINSWARTGMGNQAYQLIKTLFNDGIYPNLWDSHAPFQIDGNFGYTSGVNEMIMQSNMGYINLLPALPDDWSEGHVDGLLARGNFEVDMDWADGQLDQAVVTSKNGGEATVQYDNIFLASVTDQAGKDVKITKLSDNRISFATEKGKSYTISQFPETVKAETPSGLQAMRVSGSQVELSWNPVASKDASYQVYRQVKGGELVKIASGIKEAHFTDTQAYDVMGTLSYRVTSLEQGTESEKSQAAEELDYRNMAGMIDDQDARVIYDGGWGNWNSDSVNYNGTIKFLQNPEGTETASLTFLGTGIEVVVCKNVDRGIYAVTVDGKDCGQADTYAASSERQAVVYSNKDLEYGLHTIVLRAMNQKCAQSSGTKVELDAFRVINNRAAGVEQVRVDTASGIHKVSKAGSTLQMTAEVTPKEVENKNVIWSVATKSGEAAGTIDENGLLTLNDKSGVVTVTAVSAADAAKSGSLDITVALPGVAEESYEVEDSVDKNAPNPAITWSGSWSTWAGEPEKHHGGTKTEASTEGDSFTYSFTGTGIEVYVQKHENFANLQVAIDDKDMGTFSMAGSSSGDNQQCLYSKKDLTDGNHTIRCTVVNRDGRKQANLDYLKVFTSPTSNPDKSALQTAIERHAGKKEIQYEETGWAAFKAAMDAAVEAMNGETASDYDALVKALDKAAEGLRERELPAPVIPAGTKGTGVAESSRAMLIWDAVEGADSYNIYISGTKKASTEENHLWLEGLTPETTYAVSVKAVNANGLESAEVIDISFTTPAAPSQGGNEPEQPAELKVEQKEAATKAQLTWKASTGAVKYRIYLDSKFVGETEKTEYALTDLVEGQAYAVKVVAVGSQGQSSAVASLRFTAKKEVIPDNPDKPDKPDKPDDPDKPPVNPTTPGVKDGDTFEVNGYNYKVTSAAKKTVAVTGVKNKKRTSVKVANTVTWKGASYQVTSIGAGAFKNCKKLKTATVGKNVEVIGSSAFANCTALKKSVLNSTKLRQIGAKAFSGCKNLKSITIKSRVLKKAGKAMLKNIHAKAVIRVPKAKYKAYKKLLAKKGQKKTVTIKK